jgi:ABC-2 type transport system permease protein
VTALVGTAALTRLAARRDRVRLAVWVLGLSVFVGATTALWADQLTNAQDMAQEARLAAASPGIRMLGLASAANVGAYAMIRNYVLLAVLAALMSIFTVVRHTRQGEETGRSELLGAGVVGRHAELAAALIVTVIADLALAVSLGVSMVVVGQPASGSFAFGAAVGAVGAVFASVAAVSAQLSSTTRGASGAAAGVLGACFVVAGASNMAGDVDASGVRVESAWPVWLSPIGWGQQMRPFAGNQWEVLLLCLPVVLVCLAVAAMLTARRDFGLGMVPQRQGHARAPRTLRTACGLAWRLQRGALAGWCVAMLGFGLIMGGMVEQVQDVTGSGRDWYERVGGSTQILDAYRASMLQMAAMASAVYVVQVLLRMAAEEANGYLEPVLATTTSRTRWAVGHAMNAAVGAALLLMVFAAAAAVAGGAVLGATGPQLRILLGAAITQLPAVLTLAAAVFALVAVLHRRAAGAAWALLIGSILAGPLFGATFGLPQWALNLSPLTHAPKAPAVDVTIAPMLALIAAVALLALSALAWLRHRDLALPA